MEEGNSMSEHNYIKTKPEEIVQYWNSHIDESELSVDFKEAHERCWRCGYKRKLERCHIIPRSLRGEDIPSNFVLLCKKCHLENPNISDPDIMWDWLKAYKASIYDSFGIIQGLAEYKKIYGNDFMEELAARNLLDRKDIIKNLFSQAEASFHFGDPHYNIATIAGLLGAALKQFDENKFNYDKE